MSPHRGALLGAFCMRKEKWQNGRKVYQYSDFKEVNACRIQLDYKTSA